MIYLKTACKFPQVLSHNYLPISTLHSFKNLLLLKVLSHQGNIFTLFLVIALQKLHKCILHQSHVSNRDC